MTVRSVVARLGATFGYAVIGNIASAQFLDIAVWKAAVMAGVFVVLDVLRSLLGAYRDGILTYDEINEAFGEKS